MDLETLFEKHQDGDIEFSLVSAKFEGKIPVQVGEDEVTQNIKATLVFNAKKGTFKVTPLINSMAISGKENEDAKVFKALSRITSFVSEKAVYFREKFRKSNPDDPDQMEMNFGEEEEGEQASPLPNGN